MVRNCLPIDNLLQIFQMILTSGAYNNSQINHQVTSEADTAGLHRLPTPLMNKLVELYYYEVSHEIHT